MSDEADLLASDPGALAVARRLAALDLSAESRVRQSLRARLVSRARRPAPFDLLSRLRLPAGLAAACAAAAVMLLFMRPHAPEPTPLMAPAAPAAVSKPAPIPASTAIKSAQIRPQQPAAKALDQNPFVSIPAPSPFETHGRVSAGQPFVTIPGSAVETRSVRIDELFVKPTL